MPNYPDIWILRHGQTEWNAAGILQGQMDSPLTPLGRKQAAAQGVILRDLDLPNAVQAWGSPLGRARASAAIAFDGLFDDIRVDDRLGEVDVGQFQGKARDDLETEHAALFDGDNWLGWQFHSPGGESLQEFSGRLQSWLDEVDRPAVVMAHGIVSRVMRGLILGLDIDGMAALPGGQGVVHAVISGEHRTYS